MSDTNKSRTSRVLNKYFFSDKEIDIKDSFLVRKLVKVYLPHLSEILIFLAIIFYWYEGIIIDYLPIIPSNWLTALLIILALLFIDKRRVRFYTIQLWYLTFLFFSLLCAFIALTRGLHAEMLFEGWLIFALFGFVLITAQTFRNKWKLFRNLVLAGLPLALFGIYQFVTGVPTSKKWLSPGEELTRVFAFFGSPNVFGVLMAIMAIVSIGLYLHQKRMSMLIISSIYLFALIFSFSRSAWLGLFAAFIMLLVVYNRRLLIWLPSVLILLLIPQIRNRLSVSLSANYWFDSSLDGRLWAITNGLYILRRYPLSGSGPGSYGGNTAIYNGSPIYNDGIQEGYIALYYTDNQFLQILVQTGFIGLLIYLSFCLSVIGNLTKRALKQDIIALVGVSAFICFLVSGLFGNVLEFGALSIPTALIIGMATSEKE